MKQHRLSELAELICEPVKKIVITTHHKPDGDAIGSSLGLYNALIQLGHEVQVITPNDYGLFLHWMPGDETVIEFETAPEKALPYLEAADLIFCLDFNDLKRVNELGDFIKHSKAGKVLIDHHLDPPGFEDFTYHDTTASSTCELVYRFLHDMELSDFIDDRVAACLYTGIMTDTGSFKFPATTPAVHRIVADLMERGANHTRIHQLVFDQMGENVLRFLGHCFSQKLRVLPAFKTAYFTVTAAELEQFELKTGDTEGLVNYALNLEGIRFAALIIDRTKLVKMSFRSKGNIPANEFSRTWFEGGGHFNAAGGQSTDSLERTEERFLEALTEFAPKILAAEN
jgi:phosphoesterase RecJ-like protein